MKRTIDAFDLIDEISDVFNFYAKNSRYSPINYFPIHLEDIIRLIKDIYHKIVRSNLDQHKLKSAQVKSAIEGMDIFAPYVLKRFLKTGSVTFNLNSIDPGLIKVVCPFWEILNVQSNFLFLSPVL